MCRLLPVRYGQPLYYEFIVGSSRTTGLNRCRPRRCQPDSMRNAPFSSSTSSNGIQTDLQSSTHHRQHYTLAWSPRNQRPDCICIYVYRDAHKDINQEPVIRRKYQEIKQQNQQWRWYAPASLAVLVPWDVPARFGRLHCLGNEFIDDATHATSITTHNNT